VRGQEVTTLVSEPLPAGTYRRQWDAARLPSGTYFYRLFAVPRDIVPANGRNGRAMYFTETKKLILLR
jgi:hypothetical protein